jgi:hypothetical protein
VTKIQAKGMKTYPYHITVKIRRLQNKERILKATREKHQCVYKGKLTKITLDP